MHNFLHIYAETKKNAFLERTIYDAFKLASDIKKNTIYLTTYSSLNECDSSTLTISMYRIYRRQRIILR